MEKLNRHELTLDDLQEQHREYAEVIGLDNLLKMSDAFGGTNIYIPQRRELEKYKIYSMIYREFDGSNLQELTQKYGVSKTTVYNIVQEKRQEISSRVKRERDSLPGQMSIMDLL
ncbi:MAG: hypothetical protein K1W20_12860 [Lachnospiraceae bacterium]